MVNSFTKSFEHLHLLSHPFYQAWMAGTLSREMLKDYATQYYRHVERFPRYISALHSLCDDSTSRRQLLDNLNKEEGTQFGVSHPDLWLQFAEGMGTPREEVKTTEPKAGIRQVTETFFELTRSSYAEGLGALFAYESQVPEIAESKIEGLRSRYAVQDPKTLEFFEVHRNADVEHRNEILTLLEQLSPSQQRTAREASRRAAGSLWNFLSEVYASA